MIKIDAQKRKLSKIGTVNVKSDKEAVTLYFRCKNQVTEHIRLSDCVVSINYKNAVEDRYMVNDLEVDGDYVTFSWLLGENATKASGKTEFSICAELLENDEVVKSWNTITSNFDVENSLRTQTAVPEAYADLFAELQTEIDGKLGADNIIAGDNVTVEKDGDDVVISSTGGGGGEIPDKSITTAKLADKAVTGQKIANSAISGQHIAQGAITDFSLDIELLKRLLPYIIDSDENGKTVMVENEEYVLADPLVSEVGVGLNLNNGKIDLDYAQYNADDTFSSDGKPIKSDDFNLYMTVARGLIGALIALKADAATTYTKTETDNLLAGKQPTGDYATNSALTTGLAGKISAPSGASDGDFLRYRNGSWVAEAIASAESEDF